MSNNARRAAELLAAVPPSKRRAYQDLSFVSLTPARTGPLGSSLPPVYFPPPHPHAPLASAVDSRVPPEELALELDEEDILSTGMASFRCREFARAARSLSACSSARGRFLSLYSRYLVCLAFVLRRCQILILLCEGKRENRTPRLE